MLTGAQIAHFKVEPNWSHGLLFTPRWGEIDSYGHVNHAAYFVWCEEVRNAYFKALGEPRVFSRFTWACYRDIAFEYMRAISPADEVLVTGRVVWIRRSSFRMEYAAWTDGLVGRGHATCVWYINNSKTAVPLPVDLRQKIIALDASKDLQPADLPPRNGPGR